MAEKYAPLTARIGPAIGVVLVGFGAPFVWGAILWLVGTRIFKANFRYMKAVEVAGMANTIAVLDVVVRTLLIFASGNLFAAPSLAVLIKNFDPQNTLHAVLAAVNLMTFWLLMVRAIGLARLSGAPVLQAAWWVITIWCIYTGALVGLAGVARAIFG